MFNPKACPRVSGGTADTINAIDATFVKAAPIPCMTRDRSNRWYVFEKQASMHPIIRMIIPTVKDLLRPYFPVILPKGIDNAAIASRNMVATQF